MEGAKRREEKLMSLKDKNVELERDALRGAQYIKGILCNRLSYVEEDFAVYLLCEALNSWSSFAREKEFACIVSSWRQWQDAMFEDAKEHEEEDDVR